MYRTAFERKGISLSQIRCLDDLPRLPVVTKELFQSAPFSQSLAQGRAPARLIKLRTSGTTGTVLDNYLSHREYIQREMFWKRLFLSRGIGLFDRAMLISLPREFKGKLTLGCRLGILRECSVFDPPARLLEQIVDFKPVVIFGYASALKAVACELRNSHTAIHPLKLVFSLGEFLSTEDRLFLQNVFQTKVLNTYAANEVGLIAWECTAHAGLHIDFDNLAVEVLDRNGVCVPAGTQGDIVVTSLNATTMPMIRYCLGDRGSLVTGSCPCGCPFPLMKIGAGRIAQDITLIDGKKVGYWTIIDAFERCVGLLRYQIVQVEPDAVRVNLVLDGRFPAEGSIGEVKNKCQALFGSGMKVEVCPVPFIKNDSSGKYKVIIGLQNKVDVASPGARPCIV